MKITREINGKEIEIELTGTELIKAFYEQQEKFDMDDILMVAEAYGYDEDDSIESAFGITEQEFLSLANEMAYEKRRNQDKYDMDFYNARDDAINTVVRRYKEQKEEQPK